MDRFGGCWMLGEMCKRFVRDMQEIDREGDKQRRGQTEEDRREIRRWQGVSVSRGRYFWRFALD